MTSEGAISCIMAVYNGAQYIEAAIGSLVRQSLRPRQIIVVDDGSTDDSGTRAVAAGEGLVELLRQPNRGMNAAREAALPLVTGDFIHFFDADDICPADSLKQMQVALQANPEWDAAFGKWRNFWIEELAAEQETEAAAHLKGEQQGYFMNAALFRASWLRSVEQVGSGHEWHGSILWLTAMRQAGAVFGRIDGITLERRIHHHNISRRKTRDDLVNLVLSLHRAARNGR